MKTAGKGRPCRHGVWWAVQGGGAKWVKTKVQTR